MKKYNIENYIRYKEDLSSVMPKDKPFYGLATLCVGVGMGSSTLVEWIGER